MKSFYEKNNKRLTFEIHEDIDECVVKKIRRRLDNDIERYLPKEIIFDFNKVSFMDSAGIGLVIGRYKLANMLGGEVKVTNLTTPVRKIFEMSGILKIIPEVVDITGSDFQRADVPQRTGPQRADGQERTGPKRTNGQERTGPKRTSYIKMVSEEPVLKEQGGKI